MVNLSDDNLRFARSHSSWGQYENSKFVEALIEEILRLRKITGDLECRDCKKPKKEHPFTWRSVGEGRHLIRHDFEDGWCGPLVSRLTRLA